MIHKYVVALLILLSAISAQGAVVKILGSAPFSVAPDSTKIYFWENTNLIEKDVLSAKVVSTACSEASQIGTKKTQIQWISENLLLIFNKTNQEVLEAWIFDRKHYSCKQINGYPAGYSVGSYFSSTSVAVIGSEVFLILEKEIPGERSKYMLGKMNLINNKFVSLIDESSAFIRQIFIHPSLKYIAINAQVLTAPDYLNYNEYEVWFLGLQDGSLHKFQSEGLYQELRYIPSTLINSAMIVGDSFATETSSTNRYFYSFVNFDDFKMSQKVLVDMRIRGFDSATETIWGDGNKDSFQKIVVMDKESISYFNPGYGYKDTLISNGKLLVYRDIGTGSVGKYDLTLIDLGTRESQSLSRCGWGGILYPAYTGYGIPTYAFSEDLMRLAYTASNERRIYVRNLLDGSCTSIDLEEEIVKHRMPVVRFIDNTYKMLITSPAGAYVSE